MNTALILSHLIVVAMIPGLDCDTDSHCEQAAATWGCDTYYSDKADSGSEIFICDRNTFERKIREYQSAGK